MDPDFWHARWETMQIGFHEGQVNAMLSAHISALHLAPSARVFLPLCGKTRDVAWLLTQGYRVVGAELSVIAVRQLFEDLAVTPGVTDHGPLTRFAAQGLDIFVGDILDLSGDLLGDIDAVYDRAALVALPSPMRDRYARHLTSITGPAQQLLVTFAYDQGVMDGPPFSIPETAVRALYGADYRITVLSARDVPGGLKGLCPAREMALHLSPL